MKEANPLYLQVDNANPLAGIQDMNDTPRAFFTQRSCVGLGISERLLVRPCFHGSYDFGER